MAQRLKAQARRSASTVEALYGAFQRCDGDAMAACYAKDATFRDPVFPHLEGADVGDMWRMLCRRAKDLRVEVRRLAVDEAAGTAEVEWEATYTFSATGRTVRNLVRSRLRLREGAIVEHVDTFSFPAWAAQALGWKGRLLGHTPLLRRKVQAQAMASLRKSQSRSVP